MDRYYDVVREAMIKLGHNEVNGDNPADVHFYNHMCNEDHIPGMYIIKPTAPTSKHFQICSWGYANSSEITFEDPCWWAFVKHSKKQWDTIQDMVQKRANKWDDSILLKWKDSKGIPDNHILVIGQMPDDETVHGFGFGDHIVKLKMIVDKLHSRNVVIKLHPRYKNPVLVKKWEDAGHTVIDGYISIHDVLPKTRVAIVENSTAGIECMMHKVPIISYGFPEYHWITKKIQTLPQLKSDVRDLGWYSEKENEMFLHWYINRYLCKDVESVKSRIQNILWM